MYRKYEQGSRRLLASGVKTCCAVTLLVMMVMVPEGIDAQPNVAQTQLAYNTDDYQNILLIIADDMGVEMVKAYNVPYKSKVGYSYPQTPNIDKLAANGILFENAWSTPYCCPTRACVFTGLYPFYHNIYSPRGTYGLATHFTTLPEILQKKYLPVPRGIYLNWYKNGLFGKWHLGTIIGNDAPLQHGWDYHAGVLAGELEEYDSWTKYVNGVEVGTVTEYATFVNVTDAANWIQECDAEGRLWMATVAFNAPHTPYHEPSGDCRGVVRPSGLSDREKYWEMVRCMDECIGWLLNQIARETLDKTTIIFIGDNGSKNETWNPVYARGHLKGTVYQGGVHIPFIVADGYFLGKEIVQVRNTVDRSGQIKYADRGSRVDALVHVVDIFATAAEIAGVNGSSGVHSISIVPYLSDPKRAPLRVYVYTELWDVRTIRDSEYKLIERVNCQYELYYIGDPALLDEGKALSLDKYSAKVNELVNEMNTIRTRY